MNWQRAFSACCYGRWAYERHDLPRERICDMYTISRKQAAFAVGVQRLVTEADRDSRVVTAAQYAATMKVMEAKR